MQPCKPDADCLVFKILDGDEWRAAQGIGSYAGSTDDLRDGFIHFSAADQLSRTAEKYFSGRDGLVLVAVRAASLGSDLRWELSRGGALFPHLYGALRTKDALWTRELSLDNAGNVSLPMDIEL